MSLTIRNISVEQGTDKQEPFYFFTNSDPLGILSNATPYNLSGKNLRMQVRVAQDPSSQLLLSYTNTLTAPGLILGSGTFTDGPPLPVNPNGWVLWITKSQTLTAGGAGGVTVPVGTYFYDIFVDDPIAGTSECYARGSFQVVSTITR